MEIREKVEKSPVVYVASILIAGFLAGITAVLGLYEITGQETISSSELENRVSKAIAAEMDGWNFTAPLYRKLPNDIVSLRRGLPLTLESGARVVTFDAKHKLDIRISNVRETGVRSWEAAVLLNAEDENRNVIIGVPATITVAHEALSGPIDIGTHSFFIFVEEILPDGTIELAVAHRVSATVSSNARGNLAVGASGRPFGIYRRIPDAPPILADHSIN